MAKPTQKHLNRREFLSRTGRGAVAGGVLGSAARSRVAQAQPKPDQPPSAKGLLIGWSTISVTPDKPVQLHGQMHERVSERVLDPCMATALALEKQGDDGPEQAIMISCDVVTVDREVAKEVRKRVAERLPDFNASKLFLNATHTHTGPTMMIGLYKEPDPGVMGPVEYGEFFTRQTVEAAVNAWNARRPGAVSRGLGHAAVGFNRIARYADGHGDMYGGSSRPDFIGVEGGNDHGIEILFLWDDEQNLTGTVINVACPSQVVESKRFVSADFWGPVREELRKLHSEDLYVYAMTGAAGDQSPRDLVRRSRNEPDMRDVPGQQEMARRIVNAVQYAYGAQTQPVSDPAFIHHAEQLDLPARKVTEAEAAASRNAVADANQDGPPKPGSRDAGIARRNQFVLDRYDAQGDAPVYPIDLHVIRLGDAAIATNPFELYVEYGKRIKARSRAEQTFLVQLTGDRALYLPTPYAVEGASYGARITENNVGPEGGDALVERTVEVINSMWEA
jgi:hypothetical protein